MRVAHRVCANNAQISPRRLLLKEGGKRRENKDNEKNMKGGRRKETNPESGARRKIFGDGLRSMRSARVGYPMHLAEGMPHQSRLGQ